MTKTSAQIIVPEIQNLKIDAVPGEAIGGL